MKTLIIDDDDYKISSIKEILNNLGITEIDAVKSLNPGLRQLRENHYDLLILDNCFPLYNESYPEKDMGMDLLYRFCHAITYREIIKDTKIIMCSSDNLDISEYKDELNILGCVKYDSSVYLNPYFEKLLLQEEKNE